MTSVPPEPYLAGLSYIEGLERTAMHDWLRAELLDQAHLLAGREDDFPVQAIVNHFPYLRLDAQRRVFEILDTLLWEWKQNPLAWPSDAVRSLLELMAALAVPGAKAKLQSLANTPQQLSVIDESLRPSIFRTIAALSSNVDRHFWIHLAEKQPELAGMAFQVLTRVAPGDAIGAIRFLPSDEAAVGGVARALPSLVSGSSPEQRDSVLSEVLSVIDTLPDETAAELRLALEQAKVLVRAVNVPNDDLQVQQFRELADAFVRGLKLVSNLDQLYATAA